MPSKYVIQSDGSVRAHCTICRRLVDIPSLSTIKVYIGETIAMVEGRVRSTMDTKSKSRSLVGSVTQRIIKTHRKVTVEDCCTACRDTLGV